jgi:uncharacterized membrane protein
MNSWKAIVAFVIAFATSLLAQIQDKTSFTDLTPLQWVVVVVSAMVTAGAVYLIPPGSGLVTPPAAPRS